MENGLKALLIGAGAMITMMVISLGLYMYHTSEQFALRLEGEIQQQHYLQEERELTQWEGREVYGSTVINFIKKNSAKDWGVCIVQLNGGTSWYNRAPGGETGIVPVKSLYAEGESTYVHPLGRYKATIQYNKNQVAVGIIFRQLQQEE